MSATLPMTEEEKRIYLEKNGIVDPVPWEELKEKLDAEKKEAHNHGMESVAGAFGFSGDDDGKGEVIPQKKGNAETE
jgi:hypothetical protein